MQTETAKSLIKLNKTFYQRTQRFFDVSRSQPWTGWQKLEPYLTGMEETKKTIKVLDIGCGNGRFASFLKTSMHKEFDYYGLDANTYLMQKAQALCEKKGIKSSFKEIDIFSALLEEKASTTPIYTTKFDLITLFGVMHHVPTTELRKKLLQWCEQLLERGGLCIITFWQCSTNESLMKRSLTPNAASDHMQTIMADLEPGDFLLDWNQGSYAVRYCHEVSPTEQQALLDSGSLKCIGEFYADGKKHQSNRYLIAKKEEKSTIRV